MGEMKIILPDEIEQEFRKMAMKRFGYQKGAISEAAKIAIKQWSNSRENETKITVDWNGLRGILKHIKKTSVELQHEVGEQIAKKYVNRH
ncbi:MAG: hypothetical protein AABX85_02130 [Nanoarchaeota archaeon]